MQTKMKFTGGSIAKLQPRDATYEVWDTERSGLGLRVQPTGKKTYFFDKKRKGQRLKKTIGSVSDISLERARAMAEDLNTEFRDGKVRGNQRASWPTFLEALELYHADGERRGLKANNARTQEIRRALGPLITKTTDSVTEDDIKDRLDTIEEEVSMGRAATLQTQLGSFYKWMRYEKAVPENFMSEIRPRKGYGVKQRYLNKEEIGIVWTACQFLSPPYRDCGRVLLLTGQRRSEAAEALKSEVSLTQSVWTILGERVKNDRDHEVPLGPVSLQIFTQRLDLDAGDYVFSSDGKAPINGFSKVLDRLNHMADLVREAYNGTVPKVEQIKPLRRFTFHDMRRTLGTQWPELLGATEDEVFVHHNHSKQGVKANYQHQTLLSRRTELMNEWEAAVLHFAKPFAEPASKIGYVPRLLTP